MSDHRDSTQDLFSHADETVPIAAAPNTEMPTRPLFSSGPEHESAS